MPVKIVKVKGGYRVATPSGVKSKCTTLANAKKQRAILNAADAGHPFTGKKKK